MLAEVQGVVTATGFGTPRRMSTGFDFNRRAMLIAVLEKRAGFFFNTMDAYINVVSGLRLDEPAADLSVAMALVSSLKDAVIGDKVLAFGEIGLAGEIRAVSHCEQRVQEAGRLGFQRCVIPFHNYKSLSKELKKELDIVPVRTVRDAFSALTVKELYFDLIKDPAVARSFCLFYYRSQSSQALRRCGLGLMFAGGHRAVVHLVI